ncbi:MAG: helix-turn-helix domain-containing protein [Candidatus Micrarchaeota archaeon]|nr:helix-turn-helix domain-containing protein [Candidatus Micrarchaeota archaeon]
MDERRFTKETMAKKIAGEIVLSDDPGKTIQKWRNIFRISQRRLADEMHVMPSVISDYESGRRKSPGIGIIKRIVDALISIDEKTGGNVIKYFSSFPEETVLSEAIIDLKEFMKPVPIKEFCSAIRARIVVRKDMAERKIYGYTVIDSLKAITDLPTQDMIKLYGYTTERCLIFTSLRRGRSPMVAIKVTNLKPGLVVLHGIRDVDELAARIGEVEGIPIAVTTMDLEPMLSSLNRLG